MKKKYYPRDGALSPVAGSKLVRGKQDWTRDCCVCGGRPTVFISKNDPAPLCGPCTFGEAETAGGNW